LEGIPAEGNRSRASHNAAAAPSIHNVLGTRDADAAVPGSKGQDGEAARAQSSARIASGPKSGLFQGSFILTKGDRVGKALLFPIKRQRNRLSHYRIGRITPELWSLLPEDDFLRRRGRRGSCAVVGNGGTLLLYELGSAIDAHDVVLRLNAGPREGFSANVGSRADLRLVNRAHMGFRESPTERVLQHVSTADALGQFAGIRRRAPQALVDMLSIDFHEHAFRYTDKGVLSNGFYAALLASEICENVTLYGFLKQWRGQVRYHYYNKEEPDGRQSTRDSLEELRLQRFLSERPGTHRHGEPCMDGAHGGQLGCGNCPRGTTCAPGVWHPVPLPGFCYGRRHPLGSGVPDVGCVRRCRGGGGECPGGLRGFCPSGNGTLWRCADRP